MISLAEARERVGNVVVYRPHPGAPAQQGTISSVGDQYVFVRYGLGSTSAATDPADLSFLLPEREVVDLVAALRDSVDRAIAASRARAAQRTVEEAEADRRSDRYEKFMEGEL